MIDPLGRYYTSETISHLLIDNIKNKAPKKVLDLGIGDASLTKAAYSKWKNALYYATEIENHKTKALKQLSFLRVYNYNTLDPNASSKLKVKFGSIDVAICNPPYIRIKDKLKYSKLLLSVKFNELLNLKYLTSEIIFFAHNLKLLKRNGELAIIVSDSLITGKDFRVFRETILKRFEVKKVIQLPDKIFSKTEARTHIIILSKSKATTSQLELFMSDTYGRLSKKIAIKKNQAVERMDFQFYSVKSKTKGLKTLKDINCIIKRGKYTFKELSKKNSSFFHSTDFKRFKKEIDFDDVANKNENSIAKGGDILMCRVGKRSVGNTAYIKKGSVVITDCIYRLTVEKKYQRLVFEALNCEEGKKWLRAFAHGVCSQVISKSDLESFPLFKK